MTPSAIPNRARPSQPPRQRRGGPGGLRIAIVTEYYYPHIGGITEHVHHFAREARHRGHHVDVITSNMEGAEPHPNIVRIGASGTVHANGSTCRLALGRGLRSAMRAALRRGRYDIVHLHAPLAPSLPMLAIQEADCPVVGTFHAYHEFSIAYLLGRRYFQQLLDRIDACIAVSTAARAAVARYFDADWTIIPNGVDTDAFSPAAPRPPELPADEPCILFVGRFDPRNGLARLIEAFRLVRGRRRPAHLVVVGDGPARDRYRRLAGDGTGVTFVGHVPSGLAGYYAGSAVYACPAVLGSFGITLLEAMACATPIVCYDTPGFRTVVRDGVQALMTPPGDAPALADALARLLDDEALRRQMGAAGRRLALRYCWPRVADAVLDVYARVLGRALVAA